MPYNPKLIGDISEMLVSAELLIRRHNILLPVGDRLPYDMAIENGNGIVRIQVRTASYNKKWDLWQGNIKRTSGMDYFVYVIQNPRVFYVIPANIVAKLATKIAFYPHRKAQQRIVDTEEFRDAWSQFE